jgi:hypothetical protein
VSIVVVVTVGVALMAQVPDALVGIDTVPAPHAAASLSTSMLIEVLHDVDQPVHVRARAARLLEDPQRHSASVERALTEVAKTSTAPSALRAHALLALARRALASRDPAAASRIAAQALVDTDDVIARAGVLVLWWQDTAAARDTLVALSLRPDAVGAAARGRLGKRPTAGHRRLASDDALGAVLDRRDGGPPPAR